MPRISWSPSNLRLPPRYRGGTHEILANAASLALYPLGVSDALMAAVLDTVPESMGSGRYHTPVVILHGYGANKSLNIRIHAGLKQAGFVNVHSLNYLPFAGEGVPSVARRLVEFVKTLCEASDTNSVHLVGHSAGGIVIREAVSRLGLDEVATTVTTIASPHHGSAYGNLGMILAGRGPLAFAAQLRPGSLYLEELNAMPLSDKVQWFAYQASLDIVAPAASATLPGEGVVNNLVVDEGHISIMLSRSLVDSVSYNLKAVEDSLEEVRVESWLENLPKQRQI